MTHVEVGGIVKVQHSTGSTDKDGVTYATIGDGTITVDGTELDDDDSALNGLNRDVTETQVVTKDETEKGYAIDMEIDTQVVASLVKDATGYTEAQWEKAMDNYDEVVGVVTDVFNFVSEQLSIGKATQEQVLAVGAVLDKGVDTLNDRENAINQELSNPNTTEERRQELTQEQNSITRDRLTMSEQGIVFLAELEGTVRNGETHVIYDDATGLAVPAGTPLPAGATIGYGHLIQPGEDFSAGLTEEQARTLLQDDLQRTYNAISNQINQDTISSFSQSQYDALVSFVFNIGPGSAAPENQNRGLYQSTIRRYLNNEEGFVNPAYPTQESAWRAFRNRGTLDSRRDAEWRLYQDGDYSGRR